MITRRSFLKAAAATTFGVLAIGTTACSSGTPSNSASGASSNSASSTPAAKDPIVGKWSTVESGFDLKSMKNPPIDNMNLSAESEGTIRVENVDMKASVDAKWSISEEGNAGTRYSIKNSTDKEIGQCIIMKESPNEMTYQDTARTGMVYKLKKD